MTIALEWERAEADAKHGNISTAQIQKVFNEVVEKTIGGTIITPSTENYLRAWLVTMQSKISASSCERYRHTVDLFLKNQGSRAKAPITSVTTASVEAFLSSRMEKGVAPKTAIVDIKTLSAAFNRASRHGLILKNPVQGVELPKLVSTERDIFTHEQVGQLLKTVGEDGDWFTLILLGYYTGARLGDCVSLTWKNVNLQDRLIIYDQQKTGKPVRVPIVNDLFERLDFISEFREKEYDYLCPDLAKRGSGGAHGLSESFVRIVKRAKIDPQNVQGKGLLKFNRLTFHSLRHSFNSTLANAGVHQEIRMKLTGHSSVGMNDRYTHTAIKPLEDAMSNLPAFLKNKENG